MKVSIIVGGRFHAFNLAEELEKKNELYQLVTSYPKFYFKNKFKIDKNKIKSFYLKEIISRSLSKIDFLHKRFNLDNVVVNYFDNQASKIINYSDSDILVGWSSFSLESFKKAQNFNCIKALERGSSHIQYQYEILKEEYELLGIKPKLPSKQIIEKEIQEYEISDYICVPSDFVKKSFIEKGFNEKKIVKIPYGVDLNSFYRKKNKLNDKKFRVVYVGSSSVRKGIYYLLKAFTELNLNDSELLIVGKIDNEIIPILKKFENFNVKYFGSKKQNDLNDYYNKADIYVTCSIEEGLSMVQAQAMACGLPVICTTNTGGEEILDDGKSGFVLPIRKVDKLKEKLIYFYENREMISIMGNNAYEKATRSLSWSNYGDKMSEFYNKVISKK